jgi:hypothetical protein
MPMIDVYAERALFPKETHKALGLDLTKAVLRAEGVAQYERLQRIEGGYPSSSHRSRRCKTRRSAGRKERAALEIIETEGTGNTMQITLELPEGHR